MKLDFILKLLKQKKKQKIERAKRKRNVFAQTHFNESLIWKTISFQ